MNSPANSNGIEPNVFTPDTKATRSSDTDAAEGSFKTMYNSEILTCALETRVTYRGIALVGA